MKILILTASPKRDEIIDTMISDELKTMGHEVWVRPMLRQGRDAVLEIMPDVVVVPPIRNPYARDFVETCKEWGLGVVSRHTEASCDWQDFKRLAPIKKAELLGRFEYVIDAEIVWGDDEKQILERRPLQVPVIAVGSLAVDPYFQPDILARYPKGPFNEKFGFDPNKRNLLIASPWGFVDSAPDLRINEVWEVRSDKENRDKHIQMIREVHALMHNHWNILVTTHPGVDPTDYKEAIKGTDIKLDCESPAINLLVPSDALVHGGSTMAMEAHFLGIPAFQFGDVNLKDANNWFITPDSPLSKVSPYFADAVKLAEAIQAAERKTNASEEALKILETGRYGKMDGQATKRAAEIISDAKGKFTLCWPRAHRDYDQLTMHKDLGKVATKGVCSVCKRQFYMINQQFVNAITSNLMIPAELKKKPLLPNFDIMCPNCGAKMFSSNQ